MTVRDAAATSPIQSDLFPSRILSFIRKYWAVFALVIVAAALSLLYFRWIGFDLGAFALNPIGDRQDAIFNSWTIYQAIDNLLHRPLQLGYAPIFAGDTDAFNYTIAPYGIAIVVLPLYLITGQNLALTYNLYLVTTFALTALSVYWLVRYLVQCPTPVAMLIGLIVAFLPYRYLQFQHIETLSMQFFFFTLICFHRVFDRPRWGWAIALAILFSLTLLTSGYLGLTLLVCCAILTIYLFFRNRKVFTRQLIVRLIIAGIIAAIFVFPFLISRLSNPTFRAGYSLHDIETYSASPLGWFASLALIYHNLIPFQGEGTLFLGIVPLVLAVIGWLRRPRVTRAPPAVEAPQSGSISFSLPSLITIYAILIVVGYILSLGPQAPLSADTGIPLPYLLLMKLPGFTFIRVPARFIMLSITGVAILGAYALTVFYKTRRRVTYRLGLSILAVAILIESVPTPRNASKDVSIQDAIGGFGTRAALNTQIEFTNPDAYNWLAQQPPGSVVFQYPVGIGDNESRFTEQYVYDEVIYHQPIINGWGSALPDWYLHTAWVAFPDATTIKILQQRQTKYVLIHNENFTDLERAAFNLHFASYMKTDTQDGIFTLIKRFSQVDVYSVKAAQ